MPESIATLSRTILHKPVRVEVTPVSSVVETIDQRIYLVENRIDLLIDLLKRNRIIRCWSSHAPSMGPTRLHAS